MNMLSVVLRAFERVLNFGPAIIYPGPEVEIEVEHCSDFEFRIFNLVHVLLHRWRHPDSMFYALVKKVVDFEDVEAIE